MMTMQSRNQYLKELRKEYLQTKKRKQRGRLLDEAEKRTSLNRKYLIEKLRPKSNLDKLIQSRKKRQHKYDGPVRVALAVCWKIFDQPCGQRLKPLLETETEKLRRLGELRCSDEVAQKLRQISFRTIDEKLKHTKEVERQKQKYHKKIHPLLYEKVPVKVFAEQDREITGNLQIDLVEHCGQSAAGEFIYTLSSTDIATGWWEGEAQIGRGQERTFRSINLVRARYPIPWKGTHSDNDTAFINWQLYQYCQQQGLEFSRSRPYKKNDNCLVEQKNWTHVRRIVGHLRYDTPQEQKLLNDLYRNELRLYKNFFQPVMKLVSKERIKGRIHRRYDQAETPYHRVLKSSGVSEQEKQKLKKTYASLNPAQLKRTIDQRLNRLYETYRDKNKSVKVEPGKKQKTHSVRFSIAQSEPLSVR